MPVLELDEGNGLYFEHVPPRDGRPTFVFVNALTGSTEMWEAEIGPALRSDGFGTLVYNFRGQADSPFSAGTALTTELIVEDLQRLMAEVKPQSPVLVGLSIGGLYAARAYLGGAPAVGLVFLNVLREIGPRLAWVNDLMLKSAQTGGVRLMMDFYMPLIANQEWTAKVRPDFLQDAPYEPLDPAHGHYSLLQHAGDADWRLPYEEIKVPVLIVSGLQDRIFFDREVVDRLTRRLPDPRTVELANAGHLIPAERPAELLAALRDFAGEFAGSVQG